MPASPVSKDVNHPDHPRQALRTKAPSVIRRRNKHYATWSSCNLCPLHAHVCNHVIGSGRLPCDVLFVGEAPGEVEDALGKPFIGPAGKILTKIIENVTSRLKKPFTYAITNVVACKPFPKGAPIAAPTEQSIEACRPRLIEFARLANPRIIIALGKVAEKHLAVPEIRGQLEPKIVNVWHPSYILRNGGEGSLEFTKTVLLLAKLFSEEL